MINEVYAQKYCCEDVSLIENYEEAVNDTTQMWDCHHRLEITDSGVIGVKELIARGLYYKRPAKELVFMTKTEHRRMHNKDRHHTEEIKTKIGAFKGKHHTEESKAKMSASHKGIEGAFKGKHHTKESKAKMSAAHKGRVILDETRAKLSAARKGKLWYNNGSTTIRVIEGEQPDGFVRGRI